MAIFLTGSTGYIGAHIASNLLADHQDGLNVLVRARDEREACERLWHSLQLHMDFPQFESCLNSRMRIFRGDITEPFFGLGPEDYSHLVRSTDSVIHCAASLNRKSEKACLNVNLRGTLEVIQLARRSRDQHGLRRFSHVSTVAVAGHRKDELVQEDAAVDWNRSDYDPYARTKKFCEHMVRELLPDVRRTIFRPSIVLGDSRRPETNQFDMVRAFVFLAGLPALPFRSSDKIDIVSVNYVANAVATLHQKPQPSHEIYHLSSGADSETFAQLTDALAKAQGKRGPTFVPSLEGPTGKMINALAGRAGKKLGGLATLLKVFLPYLVWNTVFDNTRVAQELGRKTSPFFTILLSVIEVQPRNQILLSVSRTADRPGRSIMIDMDMAFEAWVGGLVELNKFEWMLGAGESWRAGERLKLLFAGYNGTRNTGSDIRAEEIVRQVRRILGAENVDCAVMTQNSDLTRGYFSGARQVHLPDIFPPFLHSEVRKNHGVIACEGSMFKSKFANAVTTMIVGALGIASAQNKLSVAYGGEAGAMDAVLQKLCARYVRDSLVITRNPESQDVLAKLGIRSELGTDTAWTFEPLGPEYGEKALRDAGWDGRTPVLAVCPINPFYWPVKPSIAKWIARTTTGAYKKSQYRSLYFHRSGNDVDAAFEKYVSAIAEGVDGYRRSRAVFPVMIGMEMLDHDACERVGAKLGGAPIFSSAGHTMFEMVSILRRCDRMLSSRFHAIVTSMPAGVPSAGVTMDERIGNLMCDRGHEHLLMKVDEPELAERITAALHNLDREADEIRDACGRIVARNLQMMARMGVYFEEHLSRQYPDFPVRKGVLSWEEYLPPLGGELRKLIEKHSAVLAL